METLVFMFQVHWLKTETHFYQSVLVICIFFDPPHAGWYKPEAYIHKLRLSKETNTDK